MLVRNPNYWNQSAAWRTSIKIVFRIEPDLATEEKDVRSGAVEVGLNLGLAALPTLEAPREGAHRALHGRPGGRLRRRGAHVQPLRDRWWVSATTRPSDENEDTADPTVRKAILLGIDRQAIVKAVAPGLTTVRPNSWMNLGASYLGERRCPTTTVSTRHRPTRCSTPPATPASPSAVSPRTARTIRAAKDGTCLVINIGTTSDDPVRVTIEIDDPHRSGQYRHQRTGGRSQPNVPAATFFGSFADGGPLATHAFDTALYHGRARDPRRA